MRILWLKSDLLLPLDKGGKLRTWHLLRHLAQRHEITYLAFAAPDQCREHLDGMREVAVRVETVPFVDRPKGSLRFRLDAALHLLDSRPYAVAKYSSSAFRRRLAHLLATGSFDLLVCDFLFPAVNLPRRLPCPAVIFTHNVESEIWRRHAANKQGAVARWLYTAQYRRMHRYEGRTLARFDGVLAVSDADRDTFRAAYPGVIRGPIHVVATGVDTGYFSPAPSDPAGRRLVFTGSMDWLPNEDAMLFFTEQILPRIRAEEPGVTLSIVGRAPTPAVSRLGAETGITVTGRVDDVRPFVRDASVYVVPLRIGGGTRLKIFEAMAMGRAVVSTTVGAEGLPVTDGTNAVIADDPARFAHAVVTLLRDADRRRAIEAAARALVVDRYDWSAVAGDLETALLAFSQRAESTRAAGRRVQAAIPAAPQTAGAIPRRE